MPVVLENKTQISREKETGWRGQTETNYSYPLEFDEDVLWLLIEFYYMMVCFNLHPNMKKRKTTLKGVSYLCHRNSSLLDA